MHNLQIYDTKLSEFLDLFYKVFRNFEFQRQKNGFFEETEMKNIYFHSEKCSSYFKNNFTAMKFTDQ